MERSARTRVRRLISNHSSNPSTKEVHGGGHAGLAVERQPGRLGIVGDRGGALCPIVRATRSTHLPFASRWRRHLLYFGDFDPSGEDMVRSLMNGWENCIRIPRSSGAALNLYDVKSRNLPPPRPVKSKPHGSQRACQGARSGKSNEPGR